ncbi:MAG: hypothetical protein SVM80_11805 [Halobacteriota archaeon]|nr:hypothetical protein [Halobacteriota archaeon]
MDTIDLKKITLQSLKLSLMPRNLLPCLLFSTVLLITFISVIFYMTDTGYGLASIPRGDSIISQMLSEIFPLTPGLIGSMLSAMIIGVMWISGVVVMDLWLIGLIIRNVSQGKFEGNITYSRKRVPRLVGIGLIIYGISFLAGSGFDLIGSVFIKQNAMNVFQIHPFAQPISPMSIAMTMTSLFILFLFFWTYQEAIIADKGIIESLKGSIDLFKDNYTVIPVVWVIYTAISMIVIILVSLPGMVAPDMALGGVIDITHGIGNDITELLWILFSSPQILFYIVGMSWCYVLELVMVTTSYIELGNEKMTDTL